MKRPLLTLIAAMALSFSSMADTLWIAGSFNNWQMPEGNNTCGALAIPETAKAGRYEGSVLFPAGTHEFALFYKDAATRTWKKYGTNQATAPFKLLRTTDDGPADVAVTLLNGDSKYYQNITLREWNGSAISFNVQTEEDSDYGSLYMTSSTAEYSPEPQTLYTLYSIDGGDWQCMSMELPSSQRVLIGREIRMMFKEKDDMNLFDAYGVMDKYPFSYSYSEEYLSSMSGGGEIPLQKGGEPVTYKGKDGLIRVSHTSIDWGRQIAWNTVERSVSDVQGLFLIGSLQQWNIDDASMQLEEVDDNVYYGKFPVGNQRELLFRFYSRLGKWWAEDCFFCYGSSYEDGEYLDISTPFKGTMTIGRGNWHIPYFTGDDLIVTADLNKMTLCVDSGSGVRHIGSGSDKSVEGIYDISGTRHDHLCPGLNIIRFTDGTAVKRLK